MHVIRKRSGWLAVLATGSVLQFGGCLDSFGRTVTSGVSNTLANAALSVLDTIFLQPIVDGVLASDEEADAV